MADETVPNLLCPSHAKACRQHKNYQKQDFPAQKLSFNLMQKKFKRDERRGKSVTLRSASSPSA